jgi:hypothetical protein
MELAALDVAFDRAFVEEGCHHIYTTLVANEYHFVCQMLWTNMQMEYATILIDNELACRESFLHRLDDFRQLALLAVRS